jgi:hypothetical protein
LEEDNSKKDDLEEDNSKKDDLKGYIPLHPCRKRIQDKFHILLKNELDNLQYDIDIKKMSINIERGIFNSSIKIYNNNQKTWNEVFKNIYINKAVTIYNNLNPSSKLENKNLLKRLIDGEFNEFELCLLEPKELFPEKWQSLYNEHCVKKNELKEETEQPDSIHKCNYCASQKKPAYKTTYYQLQTRSAKIIGWKSTLLITSWLCYWKNSCSPSSILKC